MLSDAPPDRGGPPEAATDPHIFVTIAPGGPAQNSERDNFARELFATVPNLKEIRIVSSEPLRSSMRGSPRTVTRRFVICSCRGSVTTTGPSPGWPHVIGKCSRSETVVPLWDAVAQSDRPGPTARAASNAAASTIAV